MQISRTRFHRSLSRSIARMSVLLLPLAAAGCPGPTDTPGTTNAEWSWDALQNSTREQRPVGTRVTYRCPAGGTAYTVWGTDVYTDDSSVCTAAVHAGKITFAQGGVVTFEMAPGQNSYQGTTRNGVTTDDWGSWERSFIFP